MHTILRAVKRNKMLEMVYLLMLFLSLHSYLPLFINSSFLNKFASDRTIGFLYTAGSILSIFFYIYFPKIIRSLGNYKTMLFAIFGEALCVTGLIFGNSFATIAVAFIAQQAILSVLFLNLDEFLEKYSQSKTSTENPNMGKIHALYFTMGNFALICTPFISGLLITTDSDYWKIFALAGVALIPMLLLLRVEFKTFKDLPYNDIRLIETIRSTWKTKDLRNITIANFFLQFFYAWMVIYTPVYLHEHIGMSWAAIGIVFSIMLIPFLIFELPVGWLADNVLGEKEMLIVGFIIIAFSSMALAFPTTTGVAVWAILLFLTRTGASIVEICTESYFFKKIKPEESNKISLFRMMRPVSYIITPIIVSTTLLVTNLGHGFLVLGACMIGAVYFALHIRDTL
ncbi:MAG: MFS transporter [Candidatus Paceibacterota bacterium]